MKQLLTLATLTLALTASGFWYYPMPPFVENPGTSPDCPESFVGYTYITNPATGGVYFEPPNGGGVGTAYTTGTFDNVAIKAIRNDLASYCAETNSVDFYIRTNRSVRFIVYYKSVPPTNAEIALNIVWPEPWLSITDLKNSSPTNLSSVTFLIHAPDTNQTYQIWYAQLLDSTNWIPHYSFKGRSTNFNHTTVAHMTTNRPYGFWRLTGGYTATNNYGIEDVDSPIGYPPPLESCTNCPPGGPIPPE